MKLFNRHTNQSWACKSIVLAESEFGLLFVCRINSFIFQSFTCWFSVQMKNITHVSHEKSVIISEDTHVLHRQVSSSFPP